MESRPHHPRPRPYHLRPRRDRDLTIRDRDHPFRDRDPIFLLSNIFLLEKHHFFTGNNFFLHEKHPFFHWRYWNLPPTECFFHAFIFICSFFRSCGLGRVVSSKTKTFETRDRDLGETRSRPIKSGLETSITAHHFCAVTRAHKSVVIGTVLLPTPTKIWLWLRG